MAMVMISLQAGYGAPLCYGAGQPTIPGYYGKDAGSLIPPSVNALPVVRTVVQNATVSQVRDNELVVNQSDDHAIIDWESFDIGADAHTRFDQQGNAAWSVLNRIHDDDPSQIYGSLTADGIVYLINPHGMLFNEGSTVNVHSLVASSLTMDQFDFINDTMTFSSGAQGGLGATDDDALVVNQGSMETNVNGSVYLLSPQVENSGTIDAPVGRIVLAAGTGMEFRQVVEGTDKKYLSDKVDVVSDSSGGNVAINETGGQLLSDMGKIEMYGSTVNQQGLVQTVTAIKKDGQIILQATDKIITGETSKTQNLISDSDEEVNNSFTFVPGEITLASGGTIEHHGAITNPAGDVTLTAKDRIYLSNTSSIDVGGVIADLDAGDSVVTATLNSVELKDEQQQKDGILLGEDISFVDYEGSTIGDVSTVLDKEFMTAAEAAVTGGNITLTATDGDIIVRERAALDFSGGSAHHETGFVDTTWLASGNRAYSISNAPDVITYDRILSSYEKTYARYGITETLSGIFTGGSMPIKTQVRDYYTGADAGLLVMSAPTIVLDGSLDGTTMPGFYQTEENELEDDLGNQYVSGVRQPAGGRFEIKDGTSQIVVTDDKEGLPDDFGADSDLAGVAFLKSDYADDDHPFYKTMLSSDTLSQSGLSFLSMIARTSIDIEEGASVTLEANGEFEKNVDRFFAQARTININGDITAPSGIIELKTLTRSVEEGNPDYISSERLGPEHIYVGKTAVISAAGETVDNSLSRDSGKAYGTAFVDGGTIILNEKTLSKENLSGDGVILREGSVLDVSGGYEIGLDGSIDAGSAGEIDLHGANVILDGYLYAYSLEGQVGGTIELFAKNVDVVKIDTRPALGEAFDETQHLLGDQAQGLILEENRLDKTGASHLILKSFSGLTVENEVDLGLSSMKMASPLSDVPSTDITMDQKAQRNIVSVTDDEIGDSSIELLAGKKSDFYYGDYSLGTDRNFTDITSWVSIKQGSELHTGPGGSISLDGPGIDVYGNLKAPAGSISLKTTADVDGMSLILEPGAELLAQGTLMPDKDLLAEDGSVSYTPLDGGDIILRAAGLLDIKHGSMINVSCTETTTRIMQGQEGETVEQVMAGNPGSVSLAYDHAVDQDGVSTLNGTIQAFNAGLDGLTGGALSIMKIDTAEGLSLSESMINDYLGSGFDSLSLGSRHSLIFTDSFRTDVGRSLTLDAPEIFASGVGGQDVTLSANKISLANTYEKRLNNTSERLDPAGNATLDLIATGYMDINGYTDISGFASVNLSANKDLVLTDKKYKEITVDPVSLGPTIPDYYGELNVNGDLTLSAARIYPTTQTDFTVHSDGKLTTVKVDDPDAGAIFSVGGRLVLEAGEIEHGGDLVAPMGEIVLCKTDNGDGTYDRADTITLLPESVISVSGDVAVKYGQYDKDSMVWTLLPHDLQDDPYKFEDLPQRQIVIHGDTVDSKDGSSLDVSGGGSVFTYLFQQAVEGSVDPLRAKNTYVLMPVSAVSNSGDKIFLTGSQGVEEGYYVIVGEDYAFAQGAVVVKDLGLAATLSGNLTSDQGYPMVVGYESTQGQDGYSPVAHAYVIRDAADVQTEGSYSYAEKAVDDAGTLVIQASTNILNASMTGWGYGSGSGGSIALSGTEVILGQTLTDPDNSKDFTDTLYVDANSLSGSGFTDLTLGNVDTTTSLTVKEGSTISVENLNLEARDSITIETKTRIDTGHDGTGAIGLLTPYGRLVLEEGGSIQAGEQLTLSGSSMDIQGTIGVDKGTLTVQSDAIAMVADGSENGLGDTGLTIDQDLWTLISGISNLEFESRTTINLDSGLELIGPQGMVLDMVRLSVVGGTGEGETTRLSADNLILRNSGDKDAFTGESAMAVSGTELILEGRDSLAVEFAPRAESEDDTGVSRQIALTGMETTHIQSDETMTLTGQGTLSDTGGDLELKARVVTGGLSRSMNEDGEEVYKTPDILVSLEDGDLQISSNGVYDGSVDLLSGSLAFEARSIEHGGCIVLPSGNVSMEGRDTGIVLKDGSLIDVSGTDESYAGSISLVSDHGQVLTKSGSVLDLSAGGVGDAGTLRVRTPEHDVSLAGTLLAQGGSGTFILDVLQAEDVSGLLSQVTGDGMDGFVYVRASSGNMGVTSNIMAHDLTLVADNGNITVSTGATIDASGETGGGEISLNAGGDNGDVVLETGSKLNASASGGDGGHVDLSSTTGRIQFNTGAEINVSGSDDHDKGTVTFRASRELNNIGANTDTLDNNVAMDLNGTITGAATVTVEARKVYKDQDIDPLAIDTLKIEASDIGTLRTETQEYLDRVATNLTLETILAGLTFDDPDDFHFTPGIEIQSDLDLVLSSQLDLNTFGVEAGTLALKTSGALTLEKSVVSHPNSLVDLTSGGDQDSWDITLVAGSDLRSAYDVAVKDGDDTGMFTINDGAMVYSESGDIDFATSGDMGLGTGVAQTYSVKNPMKGSLVTFDGDITGKVGGNLTLSGSAIQSGTGDIRLNTDGDILLKKKSNIWGSIRTTGEAPVDTTQVYYDSSFINILTRYDLTWLYDDGGDILLHTNGNIYGAPLVGTWGNNRIVNKLDAETQGFIPELVWSANYGSSQSASQGILTMGGGDVNLWSEGNITCQAGTFGKGDLEVQAGGDLNGRFRVSDGTGSLFTAGSFGTLSRYKDQTLELLDGSMSLCAQGQVILGSILSPTLVDFDDENSGYYWNPGYTQETWAMVESRFGDITISGTSGYDIITNTNITNLANLLPPSLTLVSGRDINILGSLSLFPSEEGTLKLISKESIMGNGYIISMSDADFAGVYTSLFTNDESEYLACKNKISPTDKILINSNLNHQDDDQSILIQAGEDIENIKLVLPKKAEIIADRDILNLIYWGQNLNEADLTLVSAGRDIIFATDLKINKNNNTAIELSGPGTLAVLVGHDMDLGTSTGIVSLGNSNNSALPNEGSDLVVLCGYENPFSLDTLSDEVISFFDTLRAEGKLYTDNLDVDEKKVGDHLDAVTAMLEDTFGKDYINREDQAELREDDAYVSEKGNINMIRSQITTKSGGDINIIAAGDINVGETVINKEKDDSTGINVQSDGDIRVFSVGDVNVNEARLMAWYGGEITVWTDAGDINAGRGSRTEISPGSTTVKYDKNGDPYEKIIPAASGSGIRAMTYDPDGLNGPLKKAVLGNVYLFAPSGIIDAGEAGIAGNSVYLGARTVLNVQNISFSQGAVGVPMGAESSVNLGAISGAGSVGAGNRMTDSAAALAAVNKEFENSADKMGETFLPTWLRVEFMGFDVDDQGL